MIVPRRNRPSALQRVVSFAPILSLLAAAGCRYPNCDRIVDDRCVDAPGDGAMPCASNDDCAFPGAVCDLGGTGRCVQCTQDQARACTGSTPVCGAELACRACATHADCRLSNACLPEGSCAAETDVAYVDPSGTDDTHCARSAPCRRVASALATGRPYVKFHGTLDEAVTVERGRVVTFLADPGATLTRTTAGSQPVVTVQDSGTELAVYDLTIGNALDTSTIGVVVPQVSGDPALALTRVKISNNPGGAIFVSGGSLRLTQSTISDNLGGGVTVNMPATFEIVGNLFIDNGTGNAPLGAVAIATIPTPSNRLEFNSFYKNASQDGVGAAIRCVAGAFTARNNIMYANGSATNHEQISGTCAHTYSLVQPGTLPPGMGNQAADPLFEGAAADDLHVRPGSPAIHAADPASDLTGVAARDLDGNIRMRPATVGAYEAP
jgi:hypothetical protein